MSEAGSGPTDLQRKVLRFFDLPVPAGISEEKAQQMVDRTLGDANKLKAWDNYRHRTGDLGDDVKAEEIEEGLFREYMPGVAPSKGKSAAPVESAAPLAARATKNRKSEFAGLGALIQVIGVVLCFVAFPWGLLAGIPLFFVGSAKALKLLCSNCGNRVEKETRICPTCKTVF